jgi:hypothetical protein
MVDNPAVKKNIETGIIRVVIYADSGIVYVDQMIDRSADRMTGRGATGANIMETINESHKIRRHGNHIRIAPNITATEGHDGLPTLTIRQRGRVVNRMRGSSLVFGSPLTADDRAYLASLAEDCLRDTPTA